MKTVLLGVLATSLVVVPLAVTSRGGGDRGARGQGGRLAPAPEVPDSAQVRMLLEGIRGANAVQCELGVHSLDLVFGWRRIEVVPDGAAESKELVRWATQRIDDPAVIPPLRAALEDPDGCVRRVAARLLGRMRTDRAVESLLDALESPSDQIRELAILGLGFAEERETTRPLVAMLDDRSPGIRTAAAWALGRIESRDAVAALTRVLRADPDANVRRTAAWALGAMH